MEVNNQNLQWQRYQMKQKALDYYKENKVPEKMEDVLNLMLHEDPFDVYGYVANYFEKGAKPVTIDKLKAYTVWDSKAEPTLCIEVYCLIKNKIKLVTSVVSAGYDIQIWDPLMIKQLREEKLKKQMSVETAIGYINGSLGETFHGKELLNSQQQTDAIIKDFFDPLQMAVDDEKRKQEAELAAANPTVAEAVPTEAEHNSASKKNQGKKSAKAAKTKVDVMLPPNDPPYEWIPGSPAGSAMSQALCSAEATLRDVQLYEHIASLAAGDNEVPTSYRLPHLMVTLLHCGKFSPGKLNAFEEVLLIPSFHFSIKESVSHLLSIHDHMISILLETYPKLSNGVNQVSDIGSITVQFDKPEQVLDLVIESIEAANLQPGKDFNIALNCASHQIIDVEKGNYEFVTGAHPKTMEDSVEFWVELVKNYPAILALIDPLRKKEGKACVQLCRSISDHCLIIGDYNIPCQKKRDSDCKEIKATDQPESSDIILQPNEEHIPEKSVPYETSGQILRLQQSTTVTDFINSVAHLTEREMYSILSVCRGEGRDTFIADLAVGSRSRFLKTGGLSRGERFQLLNRLIYIEKILTDAGQLEKDTDHWTFPKLDINKHSTESSEQNYEA